MGNEVMEEKVQDKGNNEETRKKDKKKKMFSFTKFKLKLIAIIILVVVVFVAGMVVYKNATTDKEAKIITKSTLEKIINVSDLSTYEATYNGITAVANSENQGEMDYYVSYEAKVKAGFNFEEIKINVDDEAKKIEIVIPEIEITDINVKAESMDYIFTNKKANDSTVSQTAYKACRADVEKECEKEKAIYDLAKQNAKNVMKALTSPFVEQLDGDYQLVIK